MVAHLIKLAVGADGVDDLKAWQDHTVAERRRAGLSAQPVCTTRHAPKRRDDVLTGGSLYWVIRGVIAVRQRIIGVDEAVGRDGVRRCSLILDRALVATEPRPRRAFQGWRYLDPADAPPDAGAGGGGHDLPESVRRALCEAGAW